MFRVRAFGDLPWLEQLHDHMIDATKDPSYQLDLVRLPQMIVQILCDQLQASLQLVQTHYYCSIPINTDSSDRLRVEKIRRWHRELKAAGIDLDRYELDYKGKPMREARVQEKCVDMAMGCDITGYAGDDAYDIALILAGDLDFKPAMIWAKHHYGKQIALATATTANAELISASDMHNLRNYLIYFEHHADALRRVDKEAE